MNEEARKLLLAIWKGLRADHWGDIEPDWFDPDNEEEEAAHLHLVIAKALLETQ